MEKYLITERQFKEIADMLRASYTIYEASLKQGEVKRITVIKGRGFSQSSYSLALERFDGSYTLRFYNLNIRTYWIYIALCLLFGITLIIPFLLLILLVYQYRKDKDFRSELEQKIDKLVKK